MVAAVTLASTPNFAFAAFLESAVALNSAEACKVALSRRSYAGKTFVLSGSYQWDWEWGAFISFDGCKMPLAAPPNELVQKIGTPAGWPSQGRAKVIFEGQIVPAKKCAWQGEPKPAANCDYFDVKQVDAFELKFSP